MNTVEPEKDIKPSNLLHRDTPLIRGRHIYYLLVLGVAAVAAAALLIAPETFQVPIIFSFPAVLVGIYILQSPFAGIYLFLLYDTLRPYDFIYALRPLRLTIVLEAITVLSWIIYLIRSKASFNWPFFNWPFTIFIALITLSVLTAENAGLAYNTFMVMIVTYVMFIAATNIVDSIARLNKLVWLFLMIHLYFALKGIYNFHFGEMLPNGQHTSGVVGSAFLGDENDFALVINIFIPMTYFMFMTLKNRFLKIFTGGLMIIYAYAIISSFSRGGWVGLMSVVIYCILNAKKKMASLAVVAMLAVVMVVVAPSSYWNEIQTISDTSESTADARIRYWQAALAIFADHPVLGVGADNGGIYLPYYISGAVNPDREWGRAFHGTIPQVLAELGIVGTACYFMMAFIVIRKLYTLRKRKGINNVLIPRDVLANGLLGGIIAYFVTATFISTVYYPQLWSLYTLSIILILVDRADVARDKAQNTVPVENGQTDAAAP
ncbi:MAG: O-antigen ligase family protein [Candidatus Zixiibacteriota bacterium]